jgi:hypothetical protein
MRRALSGDRSARVKMRAPPVREMRLRSATRLLRVPGRRMLQHQWTVPDGLHYRSERKLQFRHRRVQLRPLSRSRFAHAGMHEHPVLHEPALPEQPHL